MVIPRGRIFPGLGPWRFKSGSQATGLHRGSGWEDSQQLAAVTQRGTWGGTQHTPPCGLTGTAQDTCQVQPNQEQTQHGGSEHGTPGQMSTWSSSVHLCGPTRPDHGSLQAPRSALPGTGRCPEPGHVAGRPGDLPQRLFAPPGIVRDHTAASWTEPVQGLLTALLHCQSPNSFSPRPPAAADTAEGPRSPALDSLSISQNQPDAKGFVTGAAGHGSVAFRLTSLEGPSEVLASQSGSSHDFKATAVRRVVGEGWAHLPQELEGSVGVGELPVPTAAVATAQVEAEQGLPGMPWSLNPKLRPAPPSLRSGIWGPPGGV